MTDKIEWGGTPGPWWVGEVDNLNTFFPYVEGEEGGVADIDVGYPNDEPETNARAIAEVPAMVALIRETVERYGKPGGPWNVPSEPGSWLDQARAILARIDGGQA